MCDQYDAVAFLRHLPQDDEQVADLLRGEHGCWFVEDQDLNVPVEQFHDLHALLFSRGELGDVGLGVDADPV